MCLDVCIKQVNDRFMNDENDALIMITGQGSQVY